MVLLKSELFISKCKLKFWTYSKPKKLNTPATFYFFKTTRIIANRAPKHFNIGQYQLKIRKYYIIVEYTLNMVSSGFLSKYSLIPTYQKFINTAGGCHLASLKIYYSQRAKFNSDVMIY